MPSAAASCHRDRSPTRRAPSPPSSAAAPGPAWCRRVDGPVLRDGDVVAEAVARKGVAPLQRRVLERERLERRFTDDRRAAAAAPVADVQTQSTPAFSSANTPEHLLQVGGLRLDPDGCDRSTLSAPCTRRPARARRSRGRRSSSSVRLSGKMRPSAKVIVVRSAAWARQDKAMTKRECAERAIAHAVSLKGRS